MYHHKFKYFNNRIRVVGKLLCKPEKYFTTSANKTHYFFLIETVNKYNKPTIVPVAYDNTDLTKPIISLVNEQVVVCGSVACRTKSILSEEGVPQYTFEQYIKLEDIRIKENEFDFNNIGAIYGEAIKKIERTLQGGSSSKNIILKVDQIYTMPRLEVFTTHQLDRFDKIEIGQKVGFKYRFVNVSNKYVNAKLDAADIFLGPNTLKNPEFVSLTIQRKENFNLDI